MNDTHAKKPGRFLPRRWGVLRRFKKEDDGATAVEFAAVGIPFFLLIFAIIESSLFFFAGQYLETSVDDVARLYRTGQLDSNTSEAEFRNVLCNKVDIIFDCSKLKTDVEVALTFEDLDDPPTPDADGNYDDAGYGYEAPGALEILQITATYEWPVITNFSAPLMTNKSGKWALMHIIAVTRTEPYE